MFTATKTGEWQVKAGAVVLHAFWTQRDAAQATAIAALYSQRCSVGDPKTWNFDEIWLPEVASFSSSFSDTCALYDPGLVRVDQEGGWWSISEKKTPEDAFWSGLGRFQDEASARVVERWAKTHSARCDIGRNAPVEQRPGHMMHYWKK